MQCVYIFYLPLLFFVPDSTHKYNNSKYTCRWTPRNFASTSPVSIRQQVSEVTTATTHETERNKAKNYEIKFESYPPNLRDAGHRCCSSVELTLDTKLETVAAST